MNDQYIITNANIIAMDVAGQHFQTMAVEDGRIAALEDESLVGQLQAKGWPTRDLGGRTVLPGFIDTHEHLMLSGSQHTAVHLDAAESIASVVDLMAEHAGRVPKGTWVRGSFLNEQTLVEKRMPTRDDLDRALPDHPVFIMHATCHLCALNTRGFEILNPPLDLDGLDKTGGAPTGVIRDPGILTFVHPAMAGIISEETKVAYLQTAVEMALKQGITTVHALDGGDLGPGDTPVIWRNRHRLPLHLVCYNQSMDLNEVKVLGLPRIGGCICSDGAFEAHTAALFEPYSDDPDNYGALTYTQAQMDNFIMAAHAEGLQIAVHCESERSIEQVLWAMEKALRAHPRSDHRHRIEHLELPTRNQIARMAKAGIMAAMQPAFIPAFIGQTDMATYRTLLGEARLDRIHPYRSILDAGIPICGGSDSPVTPYNPLAGIQAAVNHPNAAERVSVREAIEMFTTTAAWSAFEEEDKGNLATGKLADLVVLEKDPFQVPADEISDIDIHSVCVAGRWHAVGETLAS
jgi:predicted amidohydrolase YtcJ